VMPEVAPLEQRPYYIALALTAVLVIGCGSSDRTEPSSSIVGLTAVAKSSEWTAEKNLMVVGENASTEVGALGLEGCTYAVPCPTTAVVRIRSSNPAVVGPADQRVSAPANVTLVALAPGTTELTFSADTVTRVVHIEVVSEPPPLDAIQIVPGPGVTAPQYDAAHNLVSVELGVESYAAFTLVALRNGAAVYGLPLIINSSPLGIVFASLGCPLHEARPILSR